MTLWLIRTRASIFTTSSIRSRRRFSTKPASTTKSQVTAGIVCDRRDNPFLTHHGQRVSFTSYVAGGFLGGSEQIYGFDLEGAQYISLPCDTILLINAEAAVVQTWGGGDRVRIFDRLFLGGSNNLRGFDFRDIGPKDNRDEPLGGGTLARATVEYTLPTGGESARRRLLRHRLCK